MQRLGSPIDLKLSGPIDLIKKSFAIFFEKDNFVLFAKIYSPLALLSILSLAQTKYFGNIYSPPSFDLLTKTPLLIPSIIVFGLLYMVVSFWVNVSGVKAAMQVLDGKGESVVEIFQSTRKILVQYALLSFVVGLIVFAGFILLVIPGVIFAVWYSFSTFVLIEKGLGIKDSLNTSKKLVEGKFWQVFGRFIIIGIFGMLLGIIFSLIPFKLGTILTSLFGGLTMLPQLLLYKELSGGSKELSE